MYISQPTLDFDPMLNKRWANVEYRGQTLNRIRINV